MELQQILYSLINILNEMSPYILLGFLIAGLLHVFVNESLLTRHLSGKGWKPVLKAAAIGIPLPLCSCGVLPTAVSLRRQGASKAATTSFLIATPQTGVDSIAATYSLLGPAFAVIRPVAALVGAIFGGMSVETFDKGSSDTGDTSDSSKQTGQTKENIGLMGKILASARYGFMDMIDTMGKWLVIGLVIAAFITVLVPNSIFTGFKEYPLVAMIIVVLIAVPMYICATGSIPIAMSLMLKGLTPGVAFVLLMAGPAANFASIVVLNRTQGKKATTIYVVSVILTAIVFGLIIDYLLPSDWFALKNNIEDHCGHLTLGWFETACSILLILLLLYSALRQIKRNRHNSKNTDNDMTRELKIEGMNCAHCRATVEKAITAVEGVEKVDVNLSTGKALIEGNAKLDDIITAVHQAGFEAKESSQD